MNKVKIIYRESHYNRYGNVEFKKVCCSNCNGTGVLDEYISCKSCDGSGKVVVDWVTYLMLSCDHKGDKVY